MYKKNGWLICRTLICFWKELEKKDETIKPTSFFYDSKSYFEHLFLWKIVKEIELLRPRHFIKPRRHKFFLAKPRKTIS